MIIEPVFSCFPFVDVQKWSFSRILAKALEHKASLSEFMRTYPTATVWATPGLVALGSGFRWFRYSDHLRSRY